MKSHENPLSLSGVVPWGRKDGQTRRKLIVAFRNFAKIAQQIKRYGIYFLIGYNSLCVFVNLFPQDGEGTISLESRVLIFQCVREKRLLASVSFPWSFILKTYEKSVEGTQFRLKLDKNIRHLYE